jgi:hypothetical protein
MFITMLFFARQKTPGATRSLINSTLAGVILVPGLISSADCREPAVGDDHYDDQERKETMKSTTTTDTHR